MNCFMKCEADRRGTLRGRRQIMLDDSDVPWHRQAKAAVGGVAAAAIGDPAHPEHEGMVEWIGGEFDPEEFDPLIVNEILSPAPARKRAAG